MIKIAPSILSADFAKMSDSIKMIEEGGADMIHCDVMDGIFVPNITFGFKMIEDIRKITDLPLDVHLMITQPERYVDRFCKSGADYVTVHVESTENIIPALDLIHKNNVKCGIVINPETEIKYAFDYLNQVDLCLLMGVHPGFGGQKFIEDTINKINVVNNFRKESGCMYEIEVDGGVNLETAGAIKKAGADILVAGSSVFCSENPLSAIDSIRNA